MRAWQGRLQIIKLGQGDTECMVVNKVNISSQLNVAI